QGIALGALEDPRANRIGSRSLGQELVDQRAAVLLRQWRQRDLDGSMRILVLEPPLESPGRRIRVRAEREEHQRRLVVDPPAGLDQEIHRRVVTPVEVLEYQEARVGT